ncbi:MAG: porin family protein [Acidobacteriia bacterium]|nr:porin family protein [Terriglobia bacterium]
MRKLIVLTLFVGLFSWSAMAADNPKAEVFGGYQYSHLEGGTGANGWNFALNGNFNDWFGITADFGGAYASVSGISIHNYTYTFGPTLSLRANKGYTPFVHALFGGDQASASFLGVSGSSSGFAALIGGGVDVNVSPRLAIRAAQADWFMVHSSGSTSSKNVRISFGIVARF